MHGLIWRKSELKLTLYKLNSIEGTVITPPQQQGAKTTFRVAYIYIQSYKKSALGLGDTVRVVGTPSIRVINRWYSQ